MCMCVSLTYCELTRRTFKSYRLFSCFKWISIAMQAALIQFQSVCNSLPLFKFGFAAFGWNVWPYVIGELCQLPDGFQQVTVLHAAYCKHKTKEEIRDQTSKRCLHNCTINCFYSTLHFNWICLAKLKKTGACDRNTMSSGDKSSSRPVRALKNGRRSIWKGWPDSSFPGPGSGSAWKEARLCCKTVLIWQVNERQLQVIRQLQPFT